MYCTPSLSPVTVGHWHDSQYHTPSHTTVNITRNTWLQLKNTFSEHLIICGVAPIWKKVDHKTSGLLESATFYDLDRLV